MVAVKGRRQPHAPIVTLESKVDAIEPVTTVVAVGVEGFGTQEVVAGMEERNALRQQYQADSQAIDAYAVCHDRFGWHLELVVVEKVQIVVRRDVVDHVRRIEGIPCLLAEVVDLGTSLRVAIFVGEHIIFQRSRNSQPYPVGITIKRVLLGWRRRPGEIIRVIPESVNISLIDDQRRAAVEGAASADGVTHAVVEGSDSRTRQVCL